MNKAQKILSEIKLLFENADQPVAPAVEPTAVQFTKAMLVDGTEVEYDKLEAGGVLSIMSQPCAAGEYTFDDGTIVTVGDAGMIVSVTPAAVVEVEPVEAAVEPVENPLLARVEKLEADILELNTQRNLQASTIKAQADILKQMFSLMDEFAGKPVEDTPIQKKAFSFSHVEGKTKSLTKFQAAASKLKEELFKN